MSIGFFYGIRFLFAEAVQRIDHRTQKEEGHNLMHQSQPQGNVEQKREDTQQELHKDKTDKYIGARLLLGSQGEFPALEIQKQNQSDHNIRHRPVHELHTAFPFRKVQ